MYSRSTEFLKQRLSQTFLPSRRELFIRRYERSVCADLMKGVDLDCCGESSTGLFVYYYICYKVVIIGDLAIIVSLFCLHFLFVFGMSN